MRLDFSVYFKLHKVRRDLRQTQHQCIVLNLLYLAGFCSIYDDTVGLGDEVQGGPKPSNWQMHVVKVMKEVIHSHRVKRLHADRKHSFTLTQANYIHTCMCTQTQANTRKATGSCAPVRLIQLHKAQRTLPLIRLRK